MKRSGTCQESWISRILMLSNFKCSKSVFGLGSFGKLHPSLQKCPNIAQMISVSDSCNLHPIMDFSYNLKWDPWPAQVHHYSRYHNYNPPCENPSDSRNPSPFVNVTLLGRRTCQKIWDQIPENMLLPCTH